jgi:hypothetical protein
VLKQFFDENSLVTVPHPPHSPDLAPSDFWIFRHILTSLARRVFYGIGKFLGPVADFLNEIQLSELQHVFHHGTERVKWVLSNNGDYYHEYTTYPESAL